MTFILTTTHTHNKEMSCPLLINNQLMSVNRANGYLRKNDIFILIRSYCLQ